jgi:ankyrin repeat protein
LGHIETVELLLREKADVDMQSFEPEPFTPVIAAASAGHADVLRVFIDHDAELMIPEGHDHTVLEIAMTKSHSNTVAILLEASGGVGYCQESIALEIATAPLKAIIRMIMVRGRTTLPADQLIQYDNLISSQYPDRVG